MTGLTAQDAIADSEEVLRRLFDQSPDWVVVVDVVTGERQPSSGAFKPDDDGVSVYRHSVLLAHSRSAVDVKMAPQNLVVGLTVDDVRHIDLDVHDDPWPAGVPDPTHVRNAAHALIVGWEGLGKSARRKRQRALRAAPSLRFVV